MHKTTTVTDDPGSRNAKYPFKMTRLTSSNGPKYLFEMTVYD